MFTVKEIARKCGVSASTISNVLNDKPNVSNKTKQRVLKVIEETGYRPNHIARGLRKQKTRTLGVIAEDIAQFTTPEVIEGITAFCEKKGYSVILENLRLYMKWKEAGYYDEKEYFLAVNPSMQQLLSVKVDGIIYVPGHARIMDCFPKDLPIPAVMTYGHLKSSKYPTIVIDDERGGYDMTKYLISMGHKKIGVIGGSANNIHTQKRILGYKRALDESGIMYCPDLIQYGNWNQEGGYTKARRLVEAKVTAIFCLSDVMACGVYDYLEEYNINVGQDISVVGFDNRELAEYIRPKLTTMKMPLVEMGERAAEQLINLVEEVAEACGTEEKLLCTLVERESVRRI